MSERIWIRCLGIILLGSIATGCANKFPTEVRTQEGTAKRSPVETRYALTLVGPESAPTEEGQSPRMERIEAAQFALMAERIEETRIETPRTRETIQLETPYSPVRESWEFIISPLILVVGVPNLAMGNPEFWKDIDQFFALLNPMMNSRNPNRTRMKILESSPHESIVKVDRVVAPVALARVEYSLDELPGKQVAHAADGAGEPVEIDALVTATLTAPPRVLKARLMADDGTEQVAAEFPIDPALGQRLYRAQSLFLEPSTGLHSSTEVARAAVELQDIGFASRSRRLISEGDAFFGTGPMSAARAGAHADRARLLQSRAEWTRSLEQVAAARAQAPARVNEWNRLAADAHEGRAFAALGNADYEQARADLLRAGSLDRTRQARLGSYVNVAIAANERAQARAREEEVKAAEVAVSSSSSSVQLAASGRPGAGDVIKQCLAREVALQACRAMPGFGKDLCKAGVRSKYAQYSCR